MMNRTYGWMGGGMWICTVLAVLVVVLLVVRD
jgi:FtsH-binding integral membrane protein